MGMSRIVDGFYRTNCGRGVMKELGRRRKDFILWGWIVGGRKYRMIKGFDEVVNLGSCMKGDENETVKMSYNCAAASNKYIRCFGQDWRMA